MRAIILAGGQGVRMHPYTKILPKPLIPIQDMPILQIILIQLREAGVTEVVLCLHYKAQQIQRYFGDGRWLGLKLNYSRASKQLGTAGPLSLVTPFDQPHLVLNADLLTTIDFADVYASHQHSGALATIVLCTHTIDIGLGVIEVDEQRRVIDILEKPQIQLLVNAGIYVLDPAVMAHIPRDTYLDMPTLLQQLLRDGQPLNSYHFTGEWLDIGTIDQYLRAEEVFRQDPARFLPSRSAPDQLLDTELELISPDLNNPFCQPHDIRRMKLLWR
jgi:NDP-mannose synthase